MGSGDTWAERCSCGQRHWGKYGAAGILLLRGRGDSREVLLQLRAAWTHEGGTWALPGGAINLIEGRRESAEEAATREAREEAGIDSSQITVVGSEITTDHGTWTYTTVIARTDGDADAHIANAESVALDWVPLDEVDARPLHSGFMAAWPVLRQKILDSLP